MSGYEFRFTPNTSNITSKISSKLTQHLGGQQKMWSFTFIIIIGIILFFVITALIMYLNRNRIKAQIAGLGDGIEYVSLTSGDCTGHDATRVFKYNNNDYIPSYDLDKITSGNDYTYSFWTYIMGYDSKKPNSSKTWGTYRYGKWKSVFNRGDRLTCVDDQGNPKTCDITTEIKIPHRQTPAVWLSPETNEIWFIVSTMSLKKVFGEGISIPDIPMNQWTNYTIVIQNRTMDIYVNGELEKSLVLTANPYKPAGNVYINDAGGYGGYFSYLVYYPRPLAPNDVKANYNYYNAMIDHCSKKNAKPSPYPICDYSDQSIPSLSQLTSSITSKLPTTSSITSKLPTISSLTQSTTTKQLPSMLFTNTAFNASGKSVQTSSPSTDDCTQQCYSSDKCIGAMYDTTKQMCTLQHDKLNSLVYLPNYQTILFGGHISGLAYK